MRRHHLWLFAIIAMVGLWLWSQRSGDGELRAPQTPAVTQAVDGSVYPGFLPVEAHAVLDRIARGERHPFRQDGGVFQNREGRLPPKPSGYYREYTVPTPRSDDRGPRRIVTGGDPPVEYWYTADHYGSFRRFELERVEPRQ
jgi:guanyl-specific ribonuclease Sa